MVGSVLGLCGRLTCKPTTVISALFAKNILLNQLYIEVNIDTMTARS
jgi:hypothetical protein